MDPFLQSTVAKNRQCFPTRSAPQSYPTSDTNNTCSEFHTPEGVYRLQQSWHIPYIVPQFLIGTHVTIARNTRRQVMGTFLGLGRARTTPNPTSSTTSSSISDVIYGSSSSTSLSEQADTVSPSGPTQYTGMNGYTATAAATIPYSTDKLTFMETNTESATLGIPIITHPSLIKQTSQSSDTPSDILTTIPTLSIESTNNEKDISNLSLTTTISNTGSFSSIFSGHWRNNHDSTSHSSPRPKNTLSKLKSSLIENVQTHSNLSKILANRQPEDAFLFYNTGACFLWMDTKIKDFLTCITFSKTIPTCHDLNKTTMNSDRLDILIGFNTGDCVWYDPLCHRYTRFNKHGVLHNAKVTDIKWVPKSEDLFMVSFEDGLVLIMDRDREDQSSQVQLQSTKLSNDYEFITGKSNYKQNPVSFWKVNRNGITAMEFSKDGSLVALVGSDGLLRVFDFTEERLYDVFSGYFGKVLCLAWSPDSKYILTGGQDDLVTIWSLAEQCIVARCQGHKSWVTSLSFDTHRCDNKVYRFASVGEDCRLILWDFSTSMLHKPKKHKQSAISSILPHWDSSNRQLVKLVSAFHPDMNGGIHSIDVNDPLIDNVTHSFKHPESKQSRFLRRRRQSNDVPLTVDNNNNNNLNWTLIKKWPTTIHPLIDKTHVPFLQPLIAIAIHGDPCTDIFFDNGDDDSDGYDDGDNRMDIIITSDRKGCVKKWCK